MADILTAEEVGSVFEWLLKFNAGLRARCEQAERGEREEHACVVALQQAVDTLRQTVGQAERERDEARAEQGMDVAQAISLSEECAAKAERIAALEAHIREWRNGFVAVLAPHDSLLAESLALVPDETGGRES